MFIDTHCHLDHPSLFLRLPVVLAAAREAGVIKYILPGVGPDGWPVIRSLAQTYDNVFPAVGLHPMFAGLYHEVMLDQIAAFAQDSVAIGEIGLDFALSEVPREIQMKALRGQLRLAVEQRLPVLLHCRKAFQELLRIVREENVGRVGGILHAFSGSPEIARDFVRLGFFVSLSGTVTWRNARKPVAVAAEIPLDHLVLETDAPDMTPEPYRGSENEPAFLVEVARRVAEIRNIDVVEVAEATTRNAERCFGGKLRKIDPILS